MRTVIVGAPLSGKTTCLRALARVLEGNISAATFRWRSVRGSALASGRTYLHTRDTSDEIRVRDLLGRARERAGLDAVPGWLRGFRAREVDVEASARHPPGVTTPAVKAAGLNTLVRVVRARVPRERFDRVMGALPADVRALVEAPPLPMEWIDFELGAALEEALAVALENDLTAVTEAAAEASREDLGTIYRAFMKLASPKYVAGRAAAIYGTYIRGSGAMRVVAEGEHHVEIAVEGVARPTPVFYALRRGNVLGALRATGVQGASCELVRGGGRTSGAVYRASWT